MNLPKGDVTTAKDEGAWQDDPAALGNRIKIHLPEGAGMSPDGRNDARRKRQ